MNNKEALDNLYNRANHDECLQQLYREKALKFLEQNENFKNIIEKDLDQYEKLKSHIIKVDNEDDYYFIVLEKTKETRELLEELKNER